MLSYEDYVVRVCLRTAARWANHNMRTALRCGAANGGLEFSEAAFG